jgi:hypothetical protein
MTEYILIGIFMISTYLGFSYLRKRYLKKYKWRNVVLNSLALVLFLALFLIGLKDDAKPFNINFRILLIVFISLYFIYEMYQDIRTFHNDKKM